MKEQTTSASLLGIMKQRRHVAVNCKLDRARRCDTKQTGNHAFAQSTPALLAHNQHSALPHAVVLALKHM